MPNLTDAAKAERLAVSLARGTLKPFWVVRVIDHYFAIPKPNMNELSLAELKTVILPRIGSSFEAEFDTTGRRVE